MLDARVTGELLAAARPSGAKVILAGDDRQLATIERGGLFTECGSAMARPKSPRSRGSTSTGSAKRRTTWPRGALPRPWQPLTRPGRSPGPKTRTRPARRWSRPGSATPRRSRDAKRFVFAYTNRDVDTLNAELRQVRRERGELARAGRAARDQARAAVFAVGDRVQFTDTDKKLRIYNGNAGTITAIDARTGRAHRDAGRGWERRGRCRGPPRSSRASGMATPGRSTRARARPWTTPTSTTPQHWRAAASYVALTRQRESAQVFVARETARDAAQLARQMARGEVKAASIAWATREELSATLSGERQAERATTAEQRGETKSWGCSSPNRRSSGGTR